MGRSNRGWSNSRGLGRVGGGWVVKSRTPSRISYKNQLSINLWEKAGEFGRVRCIQVRACLGAGFRLGLAGVGPGPGLDATEGLLRHCKEKVSMIGLELPP